MGQRNTSQAKRQAEKLEAWAKVGFASREVMRLRKDVNAKRRELHDAEKTRDELTSIEEAL